MRLHVIISINLPIKRGDKNKNKALIGEALLHHFSQERVVFGTLWVAQIFKNLCWDKNTRCDVTLFCLFCQDFRVASSVWYSMISWGSVEWCIQATSARPAPEGQEVCSFSFFLYDTLGFSSGHYHEVILYPSSFQSTISDSHDDSDDNWRAIIPKYQRKERVWDQSWGGGKESASVSADQVPEVAYLLSHTGMRPFVLLTLRWHYLYSQLRTPRGQSNFGVDNTL